MISPADSFRIFLASEPIDFRKGMDGLPLKKGRAATMTPDYTRQGTTTLFAALDVKSGMVIGDGMPRHRAKEFPTFQRRIDRAVRKPRDIHLVFDNDPTHKTPEVHDLARKASALQAALHAHQRLVDEHGRTFLRRNHHPPPPQGKLLQRR